MVTCCLVCFFFSSRRRHTRFDCDWSSDVCSSDLVVVLTTTMSHRRGCEPMRGRIGRYGCDWRVRCGQWEHSEGRRRDTLGTRSRPEQPRENPEQPEHPEAPRYAVLAGAQTRRPCALAAAPPPAATPTPP